MKARNFIIIAVSLLFFVGLIFLNSTKEKGNDWVRYYSINKTTPYGLSAVYDFAKGIYKEDFEDVNGSLYDFFDNDSSVNSNFIYINNEVDFSSFEETKIKKYAAKGNNVLIVASDVSYSFIEEDFGLFVDIKYNDWSWDNDNYSNYYCYLSELNFPEELADKTFYVEGAADQLSYFSKDLDYGRFTPLGFVKAEDYLYEEDNGYSASIVDGDAKKKKANKYDVEEEYIIDYTQSEKEQYSKYNCNFVKVKYGKGNFIICLEPDMFVNYNIVNNYNIDYAKSVFSTMPLQKTFWYIPYTDDVYQSVDQSPLRFILKNKYLKTAYYILLLALILFMIFGSKRKQKAIPIVSPPQNDTKIYVDTLAQAYYNEKADRKIALMQISQFKKDISHLLHYDIEFRNTNTYKDIQNLMPATVDKDMIKRAIRLMRRIEVEGRYVDPATVVIVNNFIQKIFEELKTVKK